jgi:hypothetical protein
MPVTMQAAASAPAPASVLRLNFSMMIALSPCPSKG